MYCNIHDVQNNKNIVLIESSHRSLNETQYHIAHKIITMYNIMQNKI